MGATLAVLGAGSILPRVGYGCSGYALRPAPGAPVTLLDCGPGSIRALAGVGVELGEVERVVLSQSIEFLMASKAVSDDCGAPRGWTLAAPIAGIPLIELAPSLRPLVGSRRRADASCSRAFGPRVRAALQGYL